VGPEATGGGTTKKSVDGKKKRRNYTSRPLLLNREPHPAGKGDEQPGRKKRKHGICPWGLRKREKKSSEKKEVHTGKIFGGTKDRHQTIMTALQRSAEDWRSLFTEEKNPKFGFDKGSIMFTDQVLNQLGGNYRGEKERGKAGSLVSGKKSPQVTGHN